MSSLVTRLEEIEQDSPIALLRRRKLVGEKMLWAYINLDKGCHVAMHSHENEQIGFVISGRVLFRLGEEGSPGYREVIVEGGSVVHLPSNLPHGVDVLEDAVILDVLSPPGPMGVDKQGGR